MIFSDKIVSAIKRNFQILRNFSYLAVLNIFNLLIPFITYPYLIRVLGSETYGSIVFAQAIMVNFSALVNFGFNLSGTKNITDNLDDKAKINEVVSSIYTIKLILWLISLLVLSFIVFTIDLLRKDYLLYFITFTVTTNELLFPQWFFHGIQRMKLIAVVNITSRVFFISLVFILVRSSVDFLYVPLLYSLAAFSSGIISVFLLIRNFGIQFKFQKRITLKKYLLESFPLFASTVSVQLYNNSSKLVVGSVLTMGELAYYDLGLKVLRLLKIPLGIISQVIYPKICIDKNLHFLNKLFLYTLIAAIAVYAFIFFFTHKIVLFLAGAEMYGSIQTVRILCISFILVGANQYFGSMRLVPFGYSKLLTLVTFNALILYAILILFLSVFDFLNIYSISWVSVIVDFFVLVVLVFFCKKNNIIK